jgi:hypothetical protein
MRWIALLVLVACLCLQPAAAASLPTTAGSLGAAVAATPRCTSAGLTVVPNITGTNVVSVAVGSIPSTCGGATLQAAVNNGSASSTGSAAIPAGGGSVTVTLAAAVTLTASTQVDALITGP